MRATSSGSSSSSGPVASAAHATASGRSRNDGRAAIAASASSTGATRVVDPWRRNATSACAVVRPPGSQPPVSRRRNASAGPNEGCRSRPGGRSARSPSSAHSRADRRRRRRRCRSSSRRRRTGARSSRLQSPRARGSRVGGRQALDGEQDTGRRLDERACVARPSPAPRARVRRVRERQPALLDRERERAPRRAGVPSASAASAALVGPLATTVELVEAAVRPAGGREPRLRARSSRSASAATAVGSTSDWPADARREPAVAAGAGHGARERVVRGVGVRSHAG